MEMGVAGADVPDVALEVLNIDGLRARLVAGRTRSDGDHVEFVTYIKADERYVPNGLVDCQHTVERG
jgi:hypothetical protein